MTPPAVRYWITPATDQMANLVVADMREADRLECEAQGLTALEAIRMSIAGSYDPKVAFANDVALGAWGVQRLGGLSLRGSPWVLTTNAVEHHKKFFLRTTRDGLAAYMQEHSLLVNMVDARYKQAIRWLTWLGFQIGEPVPAGPNGELFVPVSIWSE